MFVSSRFLRTRLICTFLLFVTMVTDAKREEIELQGGQPYNLTVTDQLEQGRTSLTWFVRAPEDSRILVRFAHFMLQNIYDTLVIGTGSNIRDSSSVIARFSGMFRSDSIIVPSNRAWLKLNSSADNVLPHRLEIILEALDHIRDVTLSDNQTTQITSPSYPNQYPNNADIVWRMSIPAGQSVTFRFLDIDMEDRYDKIIIGTGSDFSDRNTHLSVLSNRFNQTDLPSDLIVPGNRVVWLRFQSDISKTFRGFLIDVTTGLDTFGELRPASSGQQIEVNSTIDIVSQNYPSQYPRRQNTTWYLNPPINELIRVDVISCHLEPKHDFIEIASRLSNKSDALVLTGYSTPRGLYAEFPVNESVSIRFQSDYSVEYQGFWIRVTSMVEKDTKATPMTEMELPNFPPGQSTNDNKIGNFMVPVLSAIGVVVLMVLVSTLTVSYYCVRRRRTKPMNVEHQVLSHLYTSPDDMSAVSTTAPASGSSAAIPMVQVSCSSRSIDSPGIHHEYHDDFDYDTVGQNNAVAASPGSSRSPRFDRHAYSVAAGASGKENDTVAYCQIEHDYAAAISGVDTAENEYANFQEDSGNKPSQNTYLEVLSDKPFYMTTIENDQKTPVTNGYSGYLPMHACKTNNVIDNKPRMPPVVTSKANNLEAKTHEYANLLDNKLSTKTTGEPFQSRKRDCSDVTTNDSCYEVMSAESNHNNVNEPVYEVKLESAGHSVVDADNAGHRTEAKRRQAVKPKVAPKKNRNQEIKTRQNNSYMNGTYDKYSISGTNQ